MEGMDIEENDNKNVISPPVVEEERQRIFFGQIKQQDRDKIVAKKTSTQPYQNNKVEVLKFGESIRKRQERHESMLNQLEKSKKSKSIVVPTNDLHVKLKLREMGQPICFFGEGPSERRQRLKELMIERGETDGTPLQVINEEKRAQTSKSEASESFFTEGTQSLYNARLFIGKYSLARAKERVTKERNFDIEVKKRAEDLTLGQLPEHSLKEDEVLIEVARRAEERQALTEVLKTYTSLSSQIGDERVLSGCAIQNLGNDRPKLIATSSWTGNCKLWCCDTMSELQVFKGHTERATDIKFHPMSGTGQSETAVNLASASSDSTIKLWSLSSKTAISTLDKHAGRVNRVEFHPSGRFIASASQDTTWRLWDIETSEELLLQEGHYRPVYDIAFQIDGSLCASVGGDSMGRIWDLRSGAVIMLLKGHVKPLFAVDFSPDGYHLATGGDDHSIRIWDLRKMRSIYTIASHSKLVSAVKYQPTNGHFLVSASFDRTCKIWDTRDYKPLRILAGHEEKVMSIDVSSDSSTFISAGFERTWKLWQSEA